LTKTKRPLTPEGGIKDKTAAPSVPEGETMAGPLTPEGELKQKTEDIELVQ